MADGAAGLLFDFVLFRQLFAEVWLVDRTLPGHVENLFPRAEETFGLTMTFQTPVHVKRIHLPGERHLVDPTMTACTSDAFLNVNAVIEVNEVGKIVHANPLDGFAGLIAVPDWLQHFAVRPDLRVTVHARFCVRHARRRGFFHGSVTVPTVDTQIADVMLMAERDRLLHRNVSIGGKRRSHHLCTNPPGQHQKEDCSQNGDFGNNVKTPMKDLSQVWIPAMLESGQLRAVG